MPKTEFSRLKSKFDTSKAVEQVMSARQDTAKKAAKEAKAAAKKVARSKKTTAAQAEAEAADVSEDPSHVPVALPTVPRGRSKVHASRH